MVCGVHLFAAFVANKKNNPVIDAEKFLQELELHSMAPFHLLLQMAEMAAFKLSGPHIPDS